MQLITLKFVRGNFAFRRKDRNPPDGCQIPLEGINKVFRTPFRMGKLNWKRHVRHKPKQIKLKIGQIYSTIGRYSQVDLKPTKPSNPLSTNALRFVTNEELHDDLAI